MNDTIVARAKRRIEEGELVTGDDVEFLPGGARIIDVPHKDVDVKVAVTEDITLEEAGLAIAQLFSPTSVTERVPIPPHIKTVGDFFDEENGMGRAFAEHLADKIFGPDPCARCGAKEKTVEKFLGRKLCRNCYPLES